MNLKKKDDFSWLMPNVPARVYFILNKIGEKRLVLQCYAIIENYPVSDIVVFINNNKINFDTVFFDKYWFVITTNLFVINEHIMELKIIAPVSFSNNELDKSSPDTRKLSIALHSMCFVPFKFMPNIIEATCPICLSSKFFESSDDFWSCRSDLTSKTCEYRLCITRERAIARVLFSLFDRGQVKTMLIHEAAPCIRGLTYWLMQNCPKFIRTGYFPNAPFGAFIGDLRNEDLENQSFSNDTFDLVLHLDVMEHLFNPFKALNEIYRTLKIGGYCLFTVPTDHNRFSSEQVAFVEEDGNIKIVGNPEYHGNPQRPEDGALVTWRYGYDLPLQISRNTLFNDIEVRRFHSTSYAVMGYMTEVYVLKRIN